MPEIVNTFPRHPNLENTLREILDDIVDRNNFNRKLVRFEITRTDVALTYQTPD
jgi:hypothetical protein